jgi:hypothetical protein
MILRIAPGSAKTANEVTLRKYSPGKHQGSEVVSSMQTVNSGRLATAANASLKPPGLAPAEARESAGNQKLADTLTPQ